jgi:hypothetical protein
MISPFPLLQQAPGSNSCFPTAVRAVLLWHGYDESPEAISRLCQETRLGCDLERAIPALREEFDVEELRADAETLRAIINDANDPEPVIVTLKPSVQSPMDHAVVLIGTEQRQGVLGIQEVVAFMDPLTGKIEEDTTGNFWIFWDFAGRRAFVIRP